MVTGCVASLPSLLSPSIPDQADTIANDLVQAGLVDGRNLVVGMLILFVSKYGEQLLINYAKHHKLWLRSAPAYAWNCKKTSA